MAGMILGLACSALPAAVPAVISQGTDGAVLLHASTATVHGTRLRYEPETNKICLGYWTEVKDWADWQFTIQRAGDYQIEVWQGCGRSQGGSEVAVEVADRRFDFVVEETGHFQIFLPRRIGRVHLTAGSHSLAIKPQRKQAAAVMDIRQVRLIPANPLAPANDAAKSLLASRRVVFLGDSITYAGEWLEFLETCLRLQSPDAAFDFINLGLPSETVSGLSEPGHAGGAFPRPDLHERLDRVLTKAKPDLIVACYGMNDGIYHPFSEERFAKFQDGIRRLREKAASAGVKVIHLTPPTFDPVPLQGRTLPAGRDEYRLPYEGYNEVLDRYSEWLLAQRGQGWDVVDVHGPMNRFLAERRVNAPGFLLAGDGVHANTQGHWLMARAFLRHLGVPDAALAEDTFDQAVRTDARAAEVLALVSNRQRIRKDAWLTDIGHLRPGMAHGKPLAEAEAEAARLAAQLTEVGGR